VANTPPETKTDETIKPFYFIRGRQAGTPLNAAIVGGGEACYDLLEILDKDRLSRLNMNILGIADENPEAPGFCYAKDLGLLTTTNFEEILKAEGGCLSNGLSAEFEHFRNERPNICCKTVKCLCIGSYGFKVALGSLPDGNGKDQPGT